MRACLGTAAAPGRRRNKELAGELLSMNKVGSLLRIVLAGFMACLCMLAFLYSVPPVGASKHYIFVWLSTLSSKYNYWAEPLEFFLLGAIVFPLMYRVMFYDNLPGDKPWRKGFSWGVILWLLRCVVVAPVMGVGFFSWNLHHALYVNTVLLAAHLIYGSLLGMIAGAPPTRKRVIVQPRISQRR
jgi:hypothetical protein